MNLLERPMRNLIPAFCLATVAGVASIPARASGEINFCVDIPTPVSATLYQPYQTVNGYAPSAIYSYAVNVNGPGAGLAPGIHIDALTQRSSDGVFIFSVDAPATIGAVTYHPADLISYNGVSYAKYLDHATDLGLGEDADITGVAFDAGGRALLVFDAPLTLNQFGGGTLAYDPRNIVRNYTSGPLPSYLTVFTGAAAALPAGSRLIGAEYFDALNLLVSVDVPVTLGAAAYAPGDAIMVNTATNAASLYYRDTAVYPNPPPNSMTDFALPLPAGEVGNSLRAGKSGGNLAFDWSAPAGCISPATVRDYAVYEGALGTWYSHKTALSCTTNGALNTTLAPAPGSTYYLVVPNNGAFEGNYGRDWLGGSIPVSSAACRPAQRGIQCN